MSFLCLLYFLDTIPFSVVCMWPVDGNMTSATFNVIHPSLSLEPMNVRFCSSSAGPFESFDSESCETVSANKL